MSTVVLVQVLDPMETEFTIDENAPFVGLEGEGTIQVDTRSVRDSYLEVFKDHQDSIQSIARGFGFDFERIQTNLSVGPPLAHLFARRVAISRRNARG